MEKKKDKEEQGRKSEHGRKINSYKKRIS